MDTFSNLGINFSHPTNVVFSVEGFALSQQEKEFFAATNPLGIILFGRNINDDIQLSALCASIRECIGKNALILVDQEGGRVRRIKFGAGEEMKAPGALLEMQEEIGLDAAKNLIYNQYKLCGLQLSGYGINVNCAPLADRYYSFADKIMGDRTFGEDISIIVECCKIVEEALAEYSVQGIIKHIPGHGRALVDSHLKLPVVEESLEELEATDFATFKQLSNSGAKIAMTAHVIYNALDPKNTATLSKKVIDYIRNEIGFKGIIITDDLSMKALPGTPAENFKQAIDAGCDIGLYCHGVLSEMKEIAKHIEEIDSSLQAKIDELSCFNSTINMEEGENAYC